MSNPAQPWTITVVIIIVAIYCHAADTVSTWADALAITAALRAGTILGPHAVRADEQRQLK
jgi:hypothetical protein